VEVGEGRARKLPMVKVLRRSPLDGKTGYCLTYLEHSGLPWRYIVDDVRRVDDETLLGFTVLDLPILRRFSFPFLLKRSHVATE
jgi:hypothetical protein